MHNSLRKLVLSAVILLGVFFFTQTAEAVRPPGVTLDTMDLGSCSSRDVVHGAILEYPQYIAVCCWNDTTEEYDLYDFSLGMTSTSYDGVLILGTSDYDLIQGSDDLGPETCHYYGYEYSIGGVDDNWDGWIVIDGEDDPDDIYATRYFDNPNVNFWLTGGDSDDYLYGSDRGDVIYGDDGDDRIWGYQGSDYLYGNRDSDRIYGGSGIDFIQGGLGDDPFLDGEGGHDNIWGNEGSDVLYGGSENDQFWGGQGADTVYGEAGNDLIWGGPDNDHLDGGSGSNTVDGDAGRDYCVNGPNFRECELPGDIFQIGNCPSRYIRYGQDRGTAATGWTMTDNIVFCCYQTAPASSFVLGMSDNLTNDDTWQLLVEGSSSADEIVWYNHATFQCDGRLMGGDARTADWTDEIRFHLGDGDDELECPDIPGNADHWCYVEAGSGEDTVYGGDGEDVFYGGPHDDYLNGGDNGDGGDVIYGEGGSDTLICDASTPNYCSLYGGDGDYDYLGGDADCWGGDGNYDNCDCEGYVDSSCEH